MIGVLLGKNLQHVSKLEELIIGHCDPNGTFLFVRNFISSMNLFTGEPDKMSMGSAFSIGKGLQYVPNLRHLDVSCYFACNIIMMNCMMSLQETCICLN